MHETRRINRNHSPLRVALILLCAIFTVEFGIMAVFLALPMHFLHGWMEAGVDAGLLSILLIPVVYFVVYRPLVLQIRELDEAESALRGVYNQLELRVRDRTRELEQRNHEIGLLAEMSHLLQVCNKPEEAYAVITDIGQRLLPDTVGTLFVLNASHNDLEAVTGWGDGTLNPKERMIAPEECWALRRGRTWMVEDLRSALSCRNAPLDAETGRYLCVPMAAQGEVLGVLHLCPGLRASESPDNAEPLNEPLAVTLAEHIAIALINLKLRETLRNQSIRDPLTGLFNRRYMEETLEREVRRAERGQLPLGVVMLDLDHFKQFNDTYGHDAGDLVLREVGATLKAGLRASDIACRYGGEEFTLILPEASLNVVLPRLEQSRVDIKQLNVRRKGESMGAITISMGVAMFPEHGATVEALLHAADRALYRAKREGRDRIVVSGSTAAGASE